MATGQAPAQAQEHAPERTPVQAPVRAPRPSFGRELFLGRLRLDLIDLPPGTGPRLEPGTGPPLEPGTGPPFGPGTGPGLDGLELDGESEAFLARLRAFCAERVDSGRIEREDRVPDEVIEGLKDLGALAIRIPQEYGGLGLPGACYRRALMLVSSVHPALSELLAAHQAIGLPQPLLLFGTEEQRRELLPRCVREICAFTLTEPDIGNDPFRIHTTAVPSADGAGYTLNGVKLWATNGVLADLLVVMATVPPSPAGPGGMTAFVVEAGAQGVTVEHRSSFLGLRGLENGVIRLHDVAVPARNRIGGEGEGLEVALAAQDTGRLSLPAVCAAAAKWSLKVAREWCTVRVQWDKPIGEHEAVAGKLAFIAATALALEAMVEVSGRHADAGLVDTRTEAELAKLYASEKAWSVADELVQIRGGRGYETAESAAARGERGVPAERLLRDLRIGRIFDGSSEALRAFVAHELLAHHRATAGGRWAGVAARVRNAGSVLRGLAGRRRWSSDLRDFGPLAGHLRFVERSSRRLARQLAGAVTRWPADVEDRQLHLGRIVDIGAELYAMTASCVYAKARRDLGSPAAELADVFCRQARCRVAELFDRLGRNTDGTDRATARRLLDAHHTWLERGVLDPSTDGPWIAQPEPGPARRPTLRRVVPAGGPGALRPAEPGRRGSHPDPRPGERTRHVA